MVFWYVGTAIVNQAGSPVKSAILFPPTVTDDSASEKSPKIQQFFWPHWHLMVTSFIVPCFIVDAHKKRRRKKATAKPLLSNLFECSRQCYGKGEKKHVNSLFASLIAASYWAVNFINSFTTIFHLSPELCSQFMCNWLKLFLAPHVTEHLTVVPPVTVVPEPVTPLCTWKYFVVFSSAVYSTKHCKNSYNKCQLSALSVCFHQFLQVHNSHQP